MNHGVYEKERIMHTHTHTPINERNYRPNSFFLNCHLNMYVYLFQFVEDKNLGNSLWCSQLSTNSKSSLLLEKLALE